MTNRTRQRHGQYSQGYTYKQYPEYSYMYSYQGVTEHISDVQRKRPEDLSGPWQEVLHIKSQGAASGKAAESAYGYYEYRNWSAANFAGDIGKAVDSIFAGNQYIPLDFQENNSFELIPALFDLDGTLAMFTTKFWREISYGAVNWGLLPFISDVKSLINSVKDVSQDRISRELSQKEKELSRSADGQYGFASVNGKFHLAGKIDISWPNMDDAHASMYMMLDELGVHPDLKTVWDVIPLSFVADYFFPVGDYLETVHPRGWFSPRVDFTGGCSFTGQARCKWFYSDATSEATARVYARRASSFVGSTRPPVQPRWSAPNARQLFNTAYLARSRFGR